MPAKMRSSARRVRSARPCSPSAQRSASARLLLPLPLGPTTALMPGPNSTTVRSANDLKPTRRSARRRARAHVRRPSCSAVGPPSSGDGRRSGSVDARHGGLCGLVSASRRLRPCPAPRTRPSSADLDDEVASWSGPSALTTRYAGRAAGARVGMLLEPALGRLEVVRRQRRRRARGAATSSRSARAAVKAPVEVDGRHEGLERPPATDAAAAPLAGSLARPGRGRGSRRARGAARCAARPRVETMAARRVVRSPRARRDGAARAPRRRPARAPRRPGTRGARSRRPASSGCSLT